MYKWKVEYILKNGEHLFGVYHGNETNSVDVFKVLFAGDANTFNGCKTVDNKGTLCVRNSDISALIVSV